MMMSLGYPEHLYMVEVGYGHLRVLVPREVEVHRGGGRGEQVQALAAHVEQLVELCANILGDTLVAAGLHLGGIP